MRFLLLYGMHIDRRGKYMAGDVIDTDDDLNRFNSEGAVKFEPLASGATPSLEEARKNAKGRHQAKLDWLFVSGVMYEATAYEWREVERIEDLAWDKWYAGVRADESLRSFRLSLGPWAGSPAAVNGEGRIGARRQDVYARAWMRHVWQPGAAERKYQKQQREALEAEWRREEEWIRDKLRWRNVIPPIRRGRFAESRVYVQVRPIRELA
jgi:hypothetical protein